MADFWIKRGDTGSALTRTLTDVDGNPVDLTGATVRFNMRPIHGDELVIDHSDVDVDADPTTGIVAYTWLPGDTDTEGGYDAEFEVEFESGEFQTFPNDGYLLIAIVSDLDEAAS